MLSRILIWRCSFSLCFATDGKTYWEIMPSPFTGPSLWQSCKVTSGGHIATTQTTLHSFFSLKHPHLRRWRNPSFNPSWGKVVVTDLQMRFFLSFFFFSNNMPQHSGQFYLQCLQVLPPHSLERIAIIELDST